MSFFLAFGICIVGLVLSDGVQGQAQVECQCIANEVTKLRAADDESKEKLAILQAQMTNATRRLKVVQQKINIPAILADEMNRRMKGAINVTCDTTVDDSPEIFVNVLTTVRCPGGCKWLGSGWDVYGEATYTTSSKLCRAAIHDYKIRDVGGEIVHVKKLPGQDLYTSSGQNGIHSVVHGKYKASMTFCTYPNIC